MSGVVVGCVGTLLQRKKGSVSTGSCSKQVSEMSQSRLMLQLAILKQKKSLKCLFLSYLCVFCVYFERYVMEYAMKRAENRVSLDSVFVFLFQFDI